MKGRLALPALTIFALLLCSGCAPTRAVTAATPSASVNDTAAWTALFQPATARAVSAPLTLQRALAIAQANNPGLAAADWDVRTASAYHDIVSGGRWGSISGDAGYSRNLDEQRLLPPHSATDPALFSDEVATGNLRLSLPLFTSGRLSSAIAAAAAGEEAATHQLARGREDLAFNVKQIFYSILTQEKVIAALAFSQQTLQEHLAQVEQLLAVGKAAEVDRLRTAVALAEVEEKLLSGRNQLTIQRQLLANLLGLDLAEPLEITGDLMADSTPTLPDTGAALTAALQQRDDYRAALAALRAREYRVDEARAGYGPEISLQGNYGGRWAVGSTSGSPAADDDGDVGQVGVMLSVPIFNGGQTAARVRQSQAQLGATRERLEQLTLQIGLEIKTAAANISSARERIVTTETAVAQAAESLRIERLKYNLGRAVIIDVLDAQRSLLTLQTSYYRALADLQIALAQWRLALGPADPAPPRNAARSGEK